MITKTPLNITGNVSGENNAYTVKMQCEAWQHYQWIRATFLPTAKRMVDYSYFVHQNHSDTCTHGMALAVSARYFFETFHKQHNIETPP